MPIAVSRQSPALADVCSSGFLLHRGGSWRAAGAASDESRSDDELLGFGAAIDALEQHADAGNSGLATRLVDRVKDTRLIVDVYVLS
jgi:hypothetical protein